MNGIIKGKIRKVTIIKTNCINEVFIVAKSVDVCYAIEICEHLGMLHEQFKYSYY